MRFKKRLEQAEELGRLAFKRRIKAQPAQDKVFMMTLQDLNECLGDTQEHRMRYNRRMQLLKAWSKGWHSENVNSITKEFI
jgi:hypothetical protein